MVDESAQGVDRCRLLSAAGGAGGDEDTRVLARERTGCPEAAGGVPERLVLRREVAVTGGDAEDEAERASTRCRYRRKVQRGHLRVELRELLSADDGVVGLARSVHLGEDLLRKGLGQPGCARS